MVQGEVKTQMKTQIHADRDTDDRRLPQMVSGDRRVDQRPSAFKGQATLEYAVVLGVVAAALIAMQFYMKRGVQGKLRDATDQVGEQYRPANTTSQYKLHSDSERHDEVAKDGTSTSTLTKDEVQNKSGSETVDTATGETGKLF